MTRLLLIEADPRTRYVIKTADVDRLTGAVDDIPGTGTPTVWEFEPTVGPALAV